jgi:hypothetical protein
MPIAAKGRALTAALIIVVIGAFIAGARLKQDITLSRIEKTVTDQGSSHRS